MSKTTDRVEIVDANLAIVSLQQQNYTHQGYTIETPIEISGWIYRCVMVKEKDEEDVFAETQPAQPKPKGRPKMEKAAEVA